MTTMDDMERRRHLMMLRHLDDEASLAASASSRVALAAAAGSKKAEEAAGQGGDEYVSMSEFAVGETPIISQKPVGYVGDAAAAPHHVEDRSLSPRIQVAIFLILEALDDIFECDLCPRSLTAANIKLSNVSMRPRFLGLVLVAKTPEVVANCIRCLAQLFREELLQTADDGNKSSLPLEVRHLLDAMTANPVAYFPLIRYHPSLLPMGNRLAFFERAYGYVREILYRVDRDGYEFVVANVHFPVDWDSRLQTNTYLLSFYNSAPDPYHPQGTSAARDKADKEAAREALRFHRNFPAHGLQMAAHAPSLHGMLFNTTDMGGMLYSVLDGVLSSVAECLHRIGHFVSLDLEILFPGRVARKKKNTALC